MTILNRSNPEGYAMRHNPSRRDFLKLAGLGTAGAAFAGRLGRAADAATQRGDEDLAGMVRMMARHLEATLAGLDEETQIANG